MDGWEYDKILDTLDSMINDKPVMPGHVAQQVWTLYPNMDIKPWLVRKIIRMEIKKKISNAEIIEIGKGKYMKI